jgi:hypothetical protein
MTFGEAYEKVAARTHAILAGLESQEDDTQDMEAIGLLILSGFDCDAVETVKECQAVGRSFLTAEFEESVDLGLLIGMHLIQTLAIGYIMGEARAREAA